MSIKKQLEKELKDSMRAQDDVRKRTLRMALSALKMAEVEKQATLKNADVLKIIQKEVKSRRESIEDARRAGRQDLAAAAEAEIAVLVDFLPQPLSNAELEALVTAAIAEVGASTPAEIGTVMKVLMPRIQGRAEGGQVSSMVRKLLAK